MKQNIQTLIAEIRAFATANSLTKSSLAKKAGFQDTTLRKFWDDDWNPTANTLSKLEVVIKKGTKQ